MKYLAVRFNKNNTKSMSRINLYEALKFIGKEDPLQVVKFTLKQKNRQLDTKITDNAYINRGILNVRKLINTNLGKGGKVTNRMIRKLILYPIKKDKLSDREDKISICQSMFLRIARAILKLIIICDIRFADELYRCTQKDTAITLHLYEKGDSIKIALPMQAYMIIASCPESRVCKTILGELGNVKHSE